MTTVSQSPSQPKWQTYALYVVMGLLTLAFLMAGGTKVMGAEMHVESYARWGYPNWFMYVTGLIEVAAIILMWIPKTRFYGAAILVVTMIGAILTHLVNAEIGAIVAPIILLILAAIVAWFNRPASVPGT